MASIFTGLAFMHGHIVNRELIQRLGRDDPVVDRSAGVGRPARATRKAERTAASHANPACRPACANC